MKIDWKQLAQSPGYRSLKAAYIRDVHMVGQETHPMRKKAELLELFRKVIGMAQHYAIRTGKSVEQVLNEWEAQRDYWWLNFYSGHHLRKLASGKPGNVQPPSPETCIRRNCFHRGPEVVFRRLRAERTSSAKDARKTKGKAARWSTERKAREARLRAYRKNL